MITDYQDGMRQLLGVIDAAWAPTGHVINYPNRKEVVPSADLPWARVSVTINSSEQRSISRPGQIYTTKGNIFIQVFTPIGDGISSTLLTNLVRILLTAMRGTSTAGTLFFMRVTPQPTVMSGAWFMTNVTAAWQFDERLNG